MNIAVIQARATSQRLPGKVLADLAGAPLLARVIDRARAAEFVDKVVVAIADERGADELQAVAVAAGVATYLGHPRDVLDRTYRAAVASDAGIVVRITSDDPFKDPAVIDTVIRAIMTDATCDYASNTLTRTYPEGLDVECIRLATLKTAWTEADRPSEREHVTPFIWTRPDRFRLVDIQLDRDLSRLRWTIDYPDDLAMARRVYEALAPDALFGMDQILDLLDRHPEIAQMNQGPPVNEGYARSVAIEETPPRGPY